MSDLRPRLDRESRRFDLAPGALERFHRRRRRRVAAQRVAAGVVAAAIATAGIWLASTAFGPGDVRRPAARVTLRVEVGGRPGPVAIGFGSVWVADSQERLVSRIDAETGTVESRIGLPQRLGAPVSIEATPDGVWVQTGVLETRPPVAPAIVRIDPATDDAAMRFALGTSEHAEVATAFGSVWSANRDTGAVVRRDARTGRVLGRMRAPRSAVMVASGAAAVWVLSKGPHDADPTAPGTVARIDPVRNEVSATIDVGVRPTAIAVDAGAVWVANVASGTLSRIDPATGDIVATIHVPAAPTSLAADQNYVWVGSPDGTVSVIERSTEDIASTFRAASGIGDLAVGSGVVWATDPGEGAVLRFRA